MSLFRKSAVLVGLLAVSAAAQAQTAINAYDRGWYSRDSATGSVAHNADNTNYLTGLNFPGNPPAATGFRSFFAFDLSSFAGQTVTSATLHLFNPGGAGTEGFFQFNPSLNSGPFETLEIRDVTTNASIVTGGFNGGTAGQFVYDDLGTGVLFGTVNVSAADNGSFVDIVLNADGLAALNASTGSTFVLGGRLGSVQNNAGSQVVFAWTNPNIVGADGTQLILETAAPIPEPETYAMMLAGLALLGFARRRRRS